jgi:hypothetical protein
MKKNFISKFFSFFASVVDTADKHSFANISANFVINNLGRYPDSPNPNLKPSGCTCSWYTARKRGRLKDSSGVDAGEYSAGVWGEIQALRTGQLAPYRKYIL